MSSECRLERQLVTLLHSRYSTAVFHFRAETRHVIASIYWPSKLTVCCINLSLVLPQRPALAMDSQKPTARTVQLATSILQHTTEIETYLAENNLPGPSFAPGTPPKLPLPPGLQTSLDAALSAVDELQALLLGPLGWLVSQVGHAVRSILPDCLYQLHVFS